MAFHLLRAADIFRDPIWQFIGALLAVAGIGLSLWFALRSTHRLAMEYRVENVASRSRTLGEGIQILYKGDLVPTVNLVRMRFVNTGRQPIRSSDFEDPISVFFGSNARVLGAEVVARRPANLPVKLLESMSPGVSIAPLLLNPSDSFSITVLVADDVAAPLVEARISNIRAVERFKGSQESMPARLLRGAVFGSITVCGTFLAMFLPTAIEILGAIVLILGAFITGALLSSRLDKKLDSDRV